MEQWVLRQRTAWINAGLLPDSPRAPEQPGPVSQPPGDPAGREIEPKRLATVGVEPRQVWQVFWAAVWTRRVLATRGLGAAILELQKAPLRPPERGDFLEQLLETLKATRLLRSLVMRQQDCLPRSIGLARALQRQAIPFDLCFGVRKIPFEAHAWVEVTGESLMDLASDLRRYTVIARFSNEARVLPDSTR